MATKAKKTDETAGDKEAEKPDTSRAGSFRRIANAFSETSVWDNHTMATFFNDEADLLDPPKEEEEPAEAPEG
jgi:hypothetical protein